MKENLLDQKNLLEKMLKQNRLDNDIQTKIDNCKEKLEKTKDNSDGATNQATIVNQINISEKFNHILKSSDKNTAINEIFSQNNHSTQGCTSTNFQNLFGSFSSTAHHDEPLNINISLLGLTDKQDNTTLIKDA